ncbi:MAG TPA: prepilin-type N-terminal cleavage/methylation domain-containing protein [Burkholderiaceae bacterium]
MQKYKIPHSKFAQQGVSLLEALIAILIFSFGVLAIVGLQASMIKNTSGSKYRSDASYIAQERIGLIWSDPGNLNSYVASNVNISTLLPGGLLTVTQPSAGQFQVTVGWTEPGETAATDATVGPCYMLVAHCFTTTANVIGG